MGMTFTPQFLLVHAAWIYDDSVTKDAHLYLTESDVGPGMFAPASAAMPHALTLATAGAAIIVAEGTG